MSIKLEIDPAVASGILGNLDNLAKKYWSDAERVYEIDVGQAVKLRNEFDAIIGHRTALQVAINAAESAPQPPAPIMVPECDRKFVLACRDEYVLVRALYELLGDDDLMDGALDDDAVEVLKLHRARHEATSEVLAGTLNIVCRNNGLHRSRKPKTLGAGEICDGACLSCKAPIEYRRE